MSYSRELTPHLFNHIREEAADALADAKKCNFRVSQDFQITCDEQLGKIVKTYASFQSPDQFDCYYGISKNDRHFYERNYRDHPSYFAQDLDHFDGNVEDVLEANFQILRCVFREFLNFDLDREMAAIMFSAPTDGPFVYPEEMKEPSVHIVWRTPGHYFNWVTDTKPMHGLYLHRLYHPQSEDEEKWALLLLGKKEWKLNTWNRYPVSDPVIHSHKV